MTGAGGPTDHPRPLLRRAWRSLDGTWEYGADPDRAARGPASASLPERIVVPFAPETPAAGLARPGSPGRAWYRRPLPGARPGHRTLLHLGAVDRVADVWVGGTHLATHEGGSTAWSVDVTDAVGESGADLVVRADDDHTDLDAPRGKQDWRPEPHAIWYPPTTGIWRTVWLEQVPQVRIEDVHWTPQAATGAVRVAVRVAGPAEGCRLRVRLRHAGRLLADETALVTRPVVEREFPVGDGGPDDRAELLWSPRHPVLLDAELALLDPRGGVLDEVASYTALRDVRVEDGRFLLNGRPHRLRLVLDQGYWPHTGATPPGTAALRRDVELTLALGFSGARKHQKVEDPRYLAWADRLGLLVWAEQPSAYRPGEVAAGRLLAEWPEAVRAQRGHPAVVAWVPVNESWGVDAAEHDPRQAALVRALAAVTDALDGTRPVSANDGWETTGGRLVGVHDYEQDPAALAARYRDAAALTRALTRRRSDGRLADLDRADAGDRAVVLSEFGGIALREGSGTDGGWGYGEATSPAQLLARYRELWAAVHAGEALAGACWTQLTDTYQEANGLLRADRTPKVDPAALAAATRGRPAP